MARTIAAMVIAMVFAVDAAQAQQALGAVPRTFWDGLQSGLGNPVIGLPHLAAVLVVGCLAAPLPKGGVMLAGVYVAASLLGAAAHIGERTVANADVFVALAAVALGLMLFRKNPLRRDVIFALFAGTGLLGGYVLGAPVAAAQREPLLGYAGGMAAVQFALALAVLFGLRALTGRPALQLLAMRVVGAFAVGAGGTVLLQRYAA